MNCGLHMAFQPHLQRPCGHVRHPDMLTFPAVSGSRHQRCKPARARCQQHSAEKSNKRILTPALPSAAAGLALWLLTEQPAFAQQAATDFSKGSYRIESYWASLGLFLISVPGQSQQVLPSCTSLPVTALTGASQLPAFLCRTMVTDQTRSQGEEKEKDL